MYYYYVWIYSRNTTHDTGVLFLSSKNPPSLSPPLCPSFSLSLPISPLALPLSLLHAVNPPEKSLQIIFAMIDPDLYVECTVLCMYSTPPVM